ncbi:DUF3017 domain-containing protein [Quadrisphaera sp. KR29]|uniref:DUF3017 domain-containing protein n=1 Tax=Quadrisphaera sp. KR29 TaxID=3461391 RepID=UPI004044A4AB
MEPARTDTGPPEPGPEPTPQPGPEPTPQPGPEPTPEPGPEPGPAREGHQAADDPAGRSAADASGHSAARSAERAPQDERAPWPPPTALVWGFGAGLLAVLVVAAAVSFGLAGLLLAGLLLLLAVLHLVLPIAALGPLAVRTPWVDATTCLLLAVGVAVLAVVAPGGLGG